MSADASTRRKREHRLAIADDPTLAVARLNLGVTLARVGKLADAAAAFNDALALQADYGAAHYNLALAQLRQGNNELAAQNFRAALRCQFDNAALRGQYGLTLARLGKPVEAEAEFRKALALGGESPEWECRLGLVLCEQGRFREGRDLIRKGHEVGASRPDWNLPSQQWLKAAERNAVLEENLTAVLADATVFHDAAEWLELARICQAKKQYRSAVRCFQSAFAANPSLATDYRNGGGRGNAARVAVLAASGQGVEALDELARARLRQQALAWLRADVAGWERGLEAGSPEFRDHVRRSLESMRRDPSLAAVRDDAALKTLPDEDGAGFRQLWSSVAELSQMASVTDKATDSTTTTSRHRTLRKSSLQFTSDPVQ